jgi:hypothetical protein
VLLLLPWILRARRLAPLLLALPMLLLHVLLFVVLFNLLLMPHVVRL